uniref:Uncharacterized protein n=1 Tax=Oryza brachyantha TaxID=4533 RepID=J3L160_ORYBR
MGTRHGDGYVGVWTTTLRYCSSCAILFRHRLLSPLGTTVSSEPLDLITYSYAPFSH